MSTVIKLNNQPIELPEEHMSLERFIEWRKIPTKAMAVAVNNHLVTRKDWEFRILENNDSVTIINAAFGG